MPINEQTTTEYSATCDKCDREYFEVWDDEDVMRRYMDKDGWTITRKPADKIPSMFQEVILCDKCAKGAG